MAKILIAEDEPDIRELVAFTLTFGGHEVVVTSNGLEAVERAPEANADMIILDVRMPRMTGYEACKALKENPRTAGVPIIFLSAKGQEAEVQAGLEAGATAYILKPFAPDELLRQIGDMLKKAPEPVAAPTPDSPKVEPPAAPEKAQPEKVKPAPQQKAKPAAQKAKAAAPPKTRPAPQQKAKPAQPKTEKAAAPEKDQPAPPGEAPRAAQEKASSS